MFLAAFDRDLSNRTAMICFAEMLSVREDLISFLECFPNGHHLRKAL